MAVIVTAEVAGQTREGYEAIRTALEPILKQGPGLILHTAHEVEDGWRIIELWESAKDANDFFAKYVHPNIAARYQAP
jgi:hypothetical protein